MTEAIKGNKIKKRITVRHRNVFFFGNALQYATLPRMKDVVSLVHIELESSWCAEKLLIVAASACIPVLLLA